MKDDKLDKAIDAAKAKMAAKDNPPVKGARLAKDGNWYVPDPRPSRKGKWMKVEKG